jgi:glycosyltransferase involved in cell wall biosynthesis
MPIAVASDMRVLILRSSHYLHGPERALLALARGLLEEDVEFTLLCLMDRDMPSVPLFGAARKAGLPTEIIYADSSFDPRLPLRVARFARAGGYTLLNAVGYKAEVVALLVGRALRLPLVSRVGGYVERTPARLRHFNRISLSAAPLFHHVMVNCRALGRLLQSRGVPRARLSLVPNGVCIDDLHRLLSERNDDTRPWADRSPIVASAGRLEYEKGHVHLLEAMTRVKERFPEAALVLLGEGSLRGPLEHAGHVLGLGDSLFFAGFLTNPYQVLASADVVAMPSLVEGMPMALLEAMALGKPVVASGVWGIPEVVADGETGFLVPPADPDALALAILRVLEGGQLRERIGKRARRFVSERFNHRRMTRLTMRAYRAALECVASPQRRGGR